MRFVSIFSLSISGMAESIRADMTLRHLERPAVERNPGILDRPLPRWICAVILPAIGSLPPWYVAKHYNSQTGLTSLICFGQVFEDQELPEVKKLHPAVFSPSGYDGQFYAQIAMDPTLRRPDLPNACDTFLFRAQRWFLPALAYALGLGQPGAILTVYALLNPAFWFELVALVVVYLRARTGRDYLCLAACVFTTGALVSIQRALTDLPAATLGFGGAMLDGTAGAALLSMAMLTKSTFVLGLARYIWPIPKSSARFYREPG